MIRVEWTLPARDDLARIDAAFAAQDPVFAERVARVAIRAGRFLSDWPGSGSLISDGGLRKWPVTGTPYILMYRILHDRIQILRVRHNREDWRAAP